jgi:DNA processing protein
MSDPFDYLRISMLPSIGPARGRALLSRFHSFRDLLRASGDELRRIDGISTQLAARILAALAVERRDGEIERCVEQNRDLAGRHGFRFLTLPDPSYPSILRSIYDPPLFLFLKGTVTEEDEPGVAVVGTRSPSDYGRQVTEEFCRTFAAERLTVVSGLAMGIDTVAHRSALRAGGRTIAVLGSGLLNIYPGVNRELAREISENGCVMSELPLHAKPDAVNFPRRNRIISGLSRSLVVVESDVRGGAMITANIALDQNRDLFAVPGSIFNARSAGPHHLLRQSMAQPATCAADVIGELAGRGPLCAPPLPAQLTLDEQAIFDLLGSEAKHIDDLAVESGKPLPTLLVELLQMELNGIVRQLPGKYFVRFDCRR